MVRLQACLSHTNACSPNQQLIASSSFVPHCCCPGSIVCAERLNHTAWQTSKCDSWLPIDRESMTYLYRIFPVHVNGTSIARTNISTNDESKRKQSIGPFEANTGFARSLTHPSPVTNCHRCAHVRGGENTTKKQNSRIYIHTHTRSLSHMHTNTIEAHDCAIARGTLCVANNRLSLIKERIHDSKSARNVKCHTALMRCSIHIWYDESARGSQWIHRYSWCSSVRRHRIEILSSSSLSY